MLPRSFSPRALLLLWGCLLWGCIGCSGVPPGEAQPIQKAIAAPLPPLGDAERKLHLESFDYVWETIRDKHWDADLGGVDWDAQRLKLRPLIETATSASQARAVLNRLVGALGQSHFGIFPPDVYDEIEGEDGETGDGTAHETVTDDGVIRQTVRSGKTVQMNQQQPERPARRRDGDGDIGFDISVENDRALVTRVVAGSPAGRTGIRLGWILFEIDDRPVSRTIDRFRNSEAEGGEMELVLRYSILARLRGNPGDEVDLVFIDGSGSEVPVKLTLDPPRGELFGLGHMPPMRVDWQFERTGAIAYLRLSAFFEPLKMMSELREFVEENLDAAGFIVDLRGNPGGIGIMASGISGLFVDEPGLKLGTMILRDGEFRFSIFPQSTTFPGSLAVLIDHGSASTSEIFAGGLRDIGRARLFGSRTAGAALPSTFERLPNGDGFQYAIANYISAGGEVLEGAGVVPDVEVSLDRKILLEGRDPVFEAARRWIEE